MCSSKLSTHCSPFKTLVEHIIYISTKPHANIFTNQKQKSKQVLDSTFGLNFYWCCPSGSVLCIIVQNLTKITQCMAELLRFDHFPHILLSLQFPSCRPSIILNSPVYNRLDNGCSPQPYGRLQKHLTSWQQLSQCITCPFSQQASET